MLMLPRGSACPIQRLREAAMAGTSTTTMNGMYLGKTSELDGVVPASPCGYRPPTGKWKDGFCDWYKNCAPSCLMGSFFNCILLGQVAQRMQYWVRFKEVVAVSSGLWCLSYLLYSALPRNTLPGGLANLIYAVFFLVLLCQLRGVVRARYAIPGDQCSDCCVSFWCSCCTLTQIARHIFNYQGSCAECSMGPDAEYMVV